MTDNPPQPLDELLYFLLAERKINIAIPTAIREKRYLLRSLMNTRPPGTPDPAILRLQDQELEQQKVEKGVIKEKDISYLSAFGKIKLWQGDITRLEADAVVNAANSSLLGCFIPGHNCIDNAIHSSAGLQLREDCAAIMKKQGHDESPGLAKITPGYNLPARHVIHTVGPVIMGNAPTRQEKALLANCYLNSLRIATEAQLESIAFCCISTGVFRFPQKMAAQIAISSVKQFILKNPQTSLKSIIFNIFKNDDLQIYTELLKNERL